MDNQHRQIAGYRDLSAEEIALMNEGKALAAQVGAYCDKLREIDDPCAPGKFLADQRWVSIGATQLQQGFMALVRAIARPTNF
jgi:hypothetical protein